MNYIEFTLMASADFANRSSTALYSSIEIHMVSDFFLIYCFMFLLLFAKTAETLSDKYDSI